MVTVVDLFGDNGVVQCNNVMVLLSANGVYDIISAKPSHTKYSNQYVI